MSTTESTVTVPDVCGADVATATSRLIEAGFDPVRTSLRFGANEQGTVSGTFPPAGAVLGAGAEVELLPPAPDTRQLAADESAFDVEEDPLHWLIPDDMIGAHERELQDVLVQRGIGYTFHAQPCVEDGRVTRIEPPSGYSSFVNFWFCSPPPEPPDPPVKIDPPV